jgi:hypothetical protein
MGRSKIEAFLQLMDSHTECEVLAWHTTTRFHAAMLSCLGPTGGWESCSHSRG